VHFQLDQEVLELFVLVVQLQRLVHQLVGRLGRRTLQDHLDLRLHRGHVDVAHRGGRARVPQFPAALSRIYRVGQCAARDRQLAGCCRRGGTLELWRGASRC
jgi:hypothetical protein